MSERSQRQHKAPRYAREVFLVSISAAGDPGGAVDGLAAPTGLAAEALCRYVHSAVYAGAGAGDLHRSLGLEPQGYLALPGASGLTALSVAALAVASGSSDAVLVVEWDGSASVGALVAEREVAHTLRRDPLRLDCAAGGDRDTAVTYVKEMLGPLSAQEHALGEGPGLAAVAASEQALREGTAALEGIGSGGDGPFTIAVLSKPGPR